ncbi:jasmonate Zim-domain protein [Striga asiatica]|uniref:Protein TIFY n=1 Tax=Striga asiatica TaxID=4170 RepID=A0A5A7Q6W1_STRAF|nr:jasmonate Zim-domain protein [Striga asiatica]
MDSSGKMDSGRFPGGRSSFSQTCALLSQYLKMNGSFGELSLALTPKSSESKETLNFLPNVEKSGRVLEKQTGQMTVFYAGRVAVFDDLPADRAMEIMALAGKSGNSAPPQTARSTAELVAGAGNILLERASHAPQPGFASDLPIARKSSLARFLEKRRDRVAANAPYQLTKPRAASPKTFL